MLKWLLAIVWIPTLIFGNTAEWQEDYSKAVETAKEQKKSMIILFTGSDWCGWCKKLEREVLDTPEFQELGSQFVFVKLDYPLRGHPVDSIRKQNEALKNQYGITGFPTVIILNNQFKKIGSIGYRHGGPKPYIAEIKAIAGKSS